MPARILLSPITFEQWHRFTSRLKNEWRSTGASGVVGVLKKGLLLVWASFWMRYAGLHLFGRVATRLATLFVGPYKSRCFLAGLNPQGYIAPTAIIQHADLRLGGNVFVSDRVLIFQHRNGGPVELGEWVHLHSEVIIEIGPRGSLTVGARTSIQPRCQFTAFEESIRIGRGVQIAPYCAFYNYDHGFKAGELIHDQPLESKGGIIVDDDAWLGVRVVVLAGVRIGKGAVVGAGAVVTHDVPDGAIAVGSPARIIRFRDNKLSLEPEMKT
jgi:acetyltransferase-like isoleucine patch superfamily enzyme